MTTTTILSRGFLTYNKDAEGLHTSENHYAVLPDGLVLKADKSVRVNHHSFSAGEDEAHTWHQIDALPIGAIYCGNYYITVQDMLPVIADATLYTPSTLYQAGLMIQVLVDQLVTYSDNASVQAPLIGRVTTINEATAFADALIVLSRTV